MRAAGVIALALASTIAGTPAAAQRYLSGPGVALADVLPPPPASGSIEDKADRAAFRATRAQEGSRRWRHAIGDVDETIPAILADFSPAAGRPLSVQATPALARLLTRMRGDVAAAVNAVKPVYARKRPFLVDAGPICQPRAALERSFDYPSGHTSWGTSVALVLAELIPHRASHILERGLEYGDSRIICGAHNASAVTAGRQAAAAVVARLHGDAGFRVDLDAARIELDRAAAIMRRIADPIVIAHRGCHAAGPGLGSTPENSLAALDHCVAIGADVMETDVRVTRDGHLVLIHDSTVDRTTNGHGLVSNLDLAEIRELRLRDDLGGAEAPLTDDRIVTVDEMLRAAAGRIVLNLDVKDPVHAQVIAAVLRAKAGDRVLFKASAGIGSPALAAIPPFDRIAFLPVLTGSSDLSQVVERQAAATNRPIGYEVPRMPVQALPAVVSAARRARGRVWGNTLWEGFVDGIGGDEEALLEPDRVWGRLFAGGVSMIQTDHPAELRRFVDKMKSR